MPREEAAREYKLMKSRIGDLVVWGDKDTTFGEMEAAREDFPTGLRSHGSLHELDIPLFVYNAKGAPSGRLFSTQSGPGALDVSRLSRAGLLSKAFFNLPNGADGVRLSEPSAVPEFDRLRQIH